MGHLSDLQTEYGKKGLNVIALTGEGRDVNLRYMVHNDSGFRYKVGIGGGGAYGVTGVPHAYLIDAEGIVRWEGSPSSLSGKTIEGYLKQVKPLDQAEMDRRAQKMLDLGESLAADKLFVRAEQQFERVAQAYPKADAAEKAKARAKEMREGDNKAEYDAQASIAKLVGGPEAPDPNAKKLKGKQIEAAAKKLAKMAEDLASETPRAAKLASEWATIFSTPWE